LIRILLIKPQDFRIFHRAARDHGRFGTPNRLVARAGTGSRAETTENAGPAAGYLLPEENGGRQGPAAVLRSTRPWKEGAT